MKTRRGWVQGYNAQTVVTPDQIIPAAEVTTEANDVRQLTGMLNQAHANVAAVMGEDATLSAAVADAGYWSEANAESQTEECELFIIMAGAYLHRLGGTRSKNPLLHSSGNLFIISGGGASRFGWWRWGTLPRHLASLASDVARKFFGRAG